MNADAKHMLLGQWMSCLPMVSTRRNSCVSPPSSSKTAPFACRSDCAGREGKDIAFDDLNDFRLVTAGGVVGRAVMVGKPDFLRNEKITVPALR